MKSAESQVTAFPASVAAGVIAMALGDGLGWDVYPPIAFLVFFALTMIVLLVSFLRDAENIDGEFTSVDQAGLQADLRNWS